ncbi:MAG: phage holin family protein [Terriglobales bacterium]
MSTTPPLRPPPGSAAAQPLSDASLLELVRQLLREASDYARDLLRLFSTELGEKTRSVGILAGLAGGAMLLLLFSFAFLSGALIGAIAWGLASWRWSLLIVGVAYGLIGMGLLLPVSHGLRSGLFRFNRTQHRLKEDAEWVKKKLAA